MIINYQKLIPLLFLSLLLLFAFANIVTAQTTYQDQAKKAAEGSSNSSEEEATGLLGKLKKAGAAAQLSGGTEKTGLINIIAQIIKVFLGIMGTVFIILMVYAGFNWMTAGGNEDKITKAKTTIRNAMIGLIITLSAYAITFFLFEYLKSAAGSVGGGSGVETS